MLNEYDDDEYDQDDGDDEDDEYQNLLLRKKQNAKNMIVRHH